MKIRNIVFISGLILCLGTPITYCNAEDKSNTLSDSSNITATPTPAVDTTKPVIKGVTNRTTYKGTKINLLKGVTAKDNVSGNLTSSIKVSSVDFNKVGKQTVTYTVTDKAGNKTTKTATLTVKSNEVACNKIMYVNVSSLNVRKSPSGDAAKVTSVTLRSKVTVIATIKNSTWVKISINGGKTVGYVNGSYLSKTQPAKPSSGGSNNNGGSSNNDGGSSNNSGGGSHNSGGGSSNNDDDDNDSPPAPDTSNPGDGW